MSLQPLHVRLGQRSVEARLVFCEGELCAVVTRADPEHDGEEGWYLEAAFGDLQTPQARTFADLRQVCDWAAATLGAIAQGPKPARLH